MDIQKNVSLKKYNTFGIDVTAKYFVEIKSESDIKDLLDAKELAKQDILVLGDGANILFTKNFPGLVIKMSMKGRRIIKENDEVVLEVSAGESWHELVMYAVEKGWGGIENLVFIPGTVGAAPVQNIAAYGQNFEDVFISLKALNLLTRKEELFEKKDCEFAYRTSRFKGRDRNKYLITAVTIKLSKEPIINTSYFETGKTYAKAGSLEQELASIATPPYSVKDVANAVMNIRKKKLPDPAEIGTAGSFFKNPVITRSDYEKLKSIDPDLQCYPVDKLSYPKLDDPSLTHDDYVKVPAGRLLDNLGWKGKRIGNVGTYPNQALAVVNYGAQASEVLEFTKAMQADIYKHYKIKLEPEVIII